MEDENQNISNSSAAPPGTNPAPSNVAGSSSSQSVGVPQPKPPVTNTQTATSKAGQTQNLADRQPQTSPPTVVTQKPKRFPKFVIFIIILLIVVAAIWFGVGYLFLQNKEIKDGQDGNLSNDSLTPTVVPTPMFSPNQIKIINGTIVRDIPLGETKTLVSKEDYKSTGITGFAKVVVSPDEKSMCFESWPPALGPALYVAKIDGMDVVEVGEKRNNCVWFPDSTKLIYINESSTGESNDIYVYDTSTLEETNITVESAESNIARVYEIVGLSADGSKIVCVYSNVSSLTTENEKNDCEVNLSTLEIVTSSTTPTSGVTSTPSAS